MAAATSAQKKDEEPKPFLILITEPILKILARKHDPDAPEIQLKPMQFWPFAVAGVALFGVGIWGGYAFMGGSVPNEHAPTPEEAARSTPAGESEEKVGTGRRRGAVIKAEQEAAAKPRRVRTRAEAAAAKAPSASFQANRALALKTASLSLALGTLLALTGAAIAVKATQWYMKVDTIAEFAQRMRRFQRSKLGRFIKKQELKQIHAARIKEVESLYKRGVLTEMERDRDLKMIEKSREVVLRPL